MTAIGAQVNPVVLSISTVAVGAFVVVNLIVDVLCGLLDPRVRTG